MVGTQSIRRFDGHGEIGAAVAAGPVAILTDGLLHALPEVFGTFVAVITAAVFAIILALALQPFHVLLYRLPVRCVIRFTLSDILAVLGQRDGVVHIRQRESLIALLLVLVFFQVNAADRGHYLLVVLALLAELVQIRFRPFVRLVRLARLVEGVEIQDDANDSPEHWRGQAAYRKEMHELNSKIDYLISAVPQIADHMKAWAQAWSEVYSERPEYGGNDYDKPEDFRYP